MSQSLTIQTSINAPVEKVWEMYNTPAHVTKWNNASDDWFTPKAENDLVVGGKFSYRMEARNGEGGFDFKGTYDEIENNRLIKYTLDDGRKVSITMESENSQTKVTIDFETESENSIEMQQMGWQAILDNFKKYVEEK